MRRLPGSIRETGRHPAGIRLKRIKLKLSNLKPGKLKSQKLQRKRPRSERQIRRTTRTRENKQVNRIGKWKGIFMLRSMKQLFGDKLGASDGEIGHVKDFYFDDQNWAIRYLVADTGSWLSGRQVLISPHSLGLLAQPDKILRVSLTRKQIEDSPPIALHKPVSRQYEEEYYQYYGWPCYWEGDGLWGMSGFPILPLPVNPPLSHPPAAGGSKAERADARLRSAQAVNGYHVKSNDGTSGHVCDFMMDAQSWAIRQLVIKTGHRLSGKEVLISTKNVDRISYDESTVFVNLTSEAVEQSDGHVMVPVGSAD
jgi:hypothetical protein